MIGPIVHGVDYDSHRIAVCGIELEEDSMFTWTGEYRRKGETAFYAIRRIPWILREQRWTRDPLGLWWIEHAFGHGPSDFTLGRVQGAIVASLPWTGVVNEVSSSEWKKGVGLKGNAAKADYIPTLRERAESFASAFELAKDMSEHVLDAFGIALYARAQNALAVGPSAG